MSDAPWTAGRVAKWIGAALGGAAVFIALILLIGMAFKTYSRHQKLADANNRVKVTAIQIRNAQQQVKVQEALADVKFAESTGIRRAQDEINKTLTPLYVQHEAIQAQERIATSGKNNTIIYVPAGTNGTPTITQSGSASAPRATTP